MIRYVLILIVLIALVGCSEPVEEVTTEEISVGVACPRGIVDDPYPGQCGMYVDVDKNGYCDNSQP